MSMTIYNIYSFLFIIVYIVCFILYLLILYVCIGYTNKGKNSYKLVVHVKSCQALPILRDTKTVFSLAKICDNTTNKNGLFYFNR